MLAGNTDPSMDPRAWRAPAHLMITELPIVLAHLYRTTDVGDVVDLELPAGIDDRHVVDLVTGAGFVVNGQPRNGAIGPRVSATRAHTLADTVGPGMTLLVCGINPSPYSADIGVGYGRPGNRFWPAALMADLVPTDRDPLAALEGGIGMTDLVKRPSRTAAEVTEAEYADGFARVERLCRWLAPGAVCFVGLSGWRTVVNPKAVAGRQSVTVGGRPAYLMPSTSGLNAHETKDSLAVHLRAAAALGRSTQEGTCTGS